MFNSIKIVIKNQWRYVRSSEPRDSPMYLLTYLVYAMFLNREKETFCRMQDYGSKTLFRMRCNLGVSTFYTQLLNLNPGDTFRQGTVG